MHRVAKVLWGVVGCNVVMGWLVLGGRWENTPVEDHLIPTLSSSSPSPSLSPWEALEGVVGCVGVDVVPVGVKVSEPLESEKKPRGNSFPFITGDGFREASDCVCDETRCDPWEGTCGVFFVKTDKLDVFMKGPLQAATSPFILITHNSDYTSPWSGANPRAKNGISQEYSEQTEAILNNPKVARWYGQNAALLHEKFTPIPIGIENRYNKYGRLVSGYLHAYRKGCAAEKTSWLLANFNPKTNPKIRGAAHQQALTINTTHPTHVTLSLQTQKKKKSQPPETILSTWSAQASSHRFCLAPTGHGLDTHRLWESLIFSCVPVVLTSPADEALEGLPVWIVSSWGEVTVEAMERKYKEMKGEEFNLAKMFLPWWVKEVRKKTVF